MKDIETNEDWLLFQERCAWHFIHSYNKEHICTRGCGDRFTCAEFYCPRIKKEVVSVKESTKIIL